MTRKASRPQPPKGLGASGCALWRAILDDLATGWELDARELAHLERACHCADRIADLDAVVRRQGVTVAGSRGQTVVHPAVSEIRQLELTRLRLLSALALDDPKAAIDSVTPAQERGRKAADARWNRQGRIEAVRRGA